MAASASILMRAFRVADSSFHTWRAGAYDPNMDDAVGDQAPPFPSGDYSDHVVIGFLGGPLARSDTDAFLLAGLGTPGTPVTFPGGGPSIVETAPGTDCRDFESISLWVVVTAAPTLPSSVRIQSYWGHKDAVVGGTDGGIQPSDDAIVEGLSPQNNYQAEHSFTSLPGIALGPYNVPVRGRRHVALIDSDTGDVEGYVLAMRIA